MKYAMINAEPVAGLLVDPAFRGAVALVHAEPSLGLELRWGDGRTAWVSADAAFGPVLAPCHLRLAMAQWAAGATPDWLSGITGWAVGGPFMEPLGGGVHARGAGADRACVFATTLAPLVAREVASDLAGTAGPRAFDDVEVRLVPDPAVGATAVRVSAAGPTAAGVVDLAAVALAAACRRTLRNLRRRRGESAG
jgi:hypothetical protein